jgi:hypothetical protein
MIKIKLISFFLVLVLSLQVVPIASIGRMLSTNQSTEELPQATTDGTGVDDVKLNSFLLPEQHQLASSFDSHISLLRIHISTGIPPNHSSDILSPPPDAVI